MARKNTRGPAEGPDESRKQVFSQKIDPKLKRRFQLAVTALGIPSGEYLERAIRDRLRRDGKRITKAVLEVKA